METVTYNEANKLMGSISGPNIPNGSDITISISRNLNLSENCRRNIDCINKKRDGIKRRKCSDEY